MWKVFTVMAALATLVKNYFIFFCIGYEKVLITSVLN